MPATKIKLNPGVSPQSYYDRNQESLGIVPDGTGLQILFKIADEYFVLAGPRAGSILTVNGGRIEDKAQPFFTQIEEEVFEETFGVLRIINKPEGLQLQVTGDKDYPLTMCEEHTVLKHKPGVYAYVTYTAVCEDMPVERLQQLAGALSPTAKFWAKLGGFLFGHVRKAPKDESFVEYWAKQQQALDELLSELTEQHQALGSELLVSPETAFEVDSVEAAWDQLRQLSDYKTFFHTFSHTVGRFSERAGYYVFNASDLLLCAQGETKQVSDVNGENVANSVFNDDAVKIAFPAIGVKQPMHRPAPAGSEEELARAKGLFAPASSGTAHQSEPVTASLADDKVQATFS